MSDRGTDGFADSLVSGLIIGVLGATFFLSDIVIRMLVRVFYKYRRHRLIVGIGGAWLASMAVAFVVASAPGLTATGVCLALAMTAACGVAVAVTEIVLDQRAQHQDAQDGEAFTDHLREWWT